jgi:hypothetical protein
MDASASRGRRRGGVSERERRSMYLCEGACRRNHGGHDGTGQTTAAPSRGQARPRRALQRLARHAAEQHQDSLEHLPTRIYGGDRNPRGREGRGQAGGDDSSRSTQTERRAVVRRVERTPWRGRSWPESTGSGGGDAEIAGALGLGF